jgi:RNA polymerase sigma-70 factor (ECF subfamily)
MEPGSRISRASTGDRAAQRELFARHAGKLRMYVEFRLGRALGRRVEVDDVVQEAFLRAWRDLERATLSGDHAFFRWLAAIARNVIADIARAARAQKRQGEVLPLERSAWSAAGSVEPADAGDGPATGAGRNELRASLHTAYLALTPQHQRVIALRQFEERSAREAAPRLGCTEMAVHALFRRALDAWARELERLEGPVR